MKSTMKVIRKQLKGVNRQVKTISRQIGRERSSGHAGMTTGLLLVGASCVAGALLIGKFGKRNRKAISELIRTTTEKTQQVQPVVFEKVQTQFSSLLEHVGFAKSEASPEGKQGSNGKKGTDGHQEKETAVPSNGRDVQTMGDV